MNNPAEPDVELDAFDLELLTVLQHEFTFTGDAQHETSLMVNAFAKEGVHTLWDAAVCETTWVKRALLDYARVLNVDPAPIHKHRMLVVPDFRFGASSRTYKGRAYVLFNSGCMHLLSFLAELDILSAALLQRRPCDTLTDQLLVWLMDSGFDLAKCFLDKPFALPLIRPYMDDEMNRVELFVLGGSELFVFLHEVAHIELGHLGSGFGDTEGAGTHPNVAEEFEADRFAMQWLGQRSPLATTGAIQFLSCFSLLDAYRCAARANTVPVKERLVGLRQAFGDTFNIPTLVDSWADARDAATEPTADPVKLGHLFKWTCNAVAQELGIEVLDKAGWTTAADGDAEDVFAIARTLHTSSKLDEACLSVIQEFVSITNPWEKKRAFIDAHPVLLSKEVEQWFVSYINLSNEESDFLLALKCDLALLRRCRDVGTANAIPIKDVLFGMMEATSLESRIELLRAHPHVLSDVGRARAEMIYDQLLNKYTDIAYRMGLVVNLIDVALSRGLDATLAHQKDLPELPEEVWQFSSQLDAAIKNRNLRKQVAICEMAIAYAAEEKGGPLWSLRFRNHLQSLPEF